MSGVCWFDSIVPWLSMKPSSIGICSRSEGTSGLSRVKCTLSNVMWITCWMPLPSWQVEGVVVVVVEGEVVVTVVLDVVLEPLPVVLVTTVVDVVVVLVLAVVVVVVVASVVVVVVVGCDAARLSACSMRALHSWSSLSASAESPLPDAAAARSILMVV